MADISEVMSNLYSDLKAGGQACLYGVHGGEKSLDFGEVLVKLLIEHRHNIGNILAVFVTAVDNFAQTLVIFSYPVFQLEMLKL